ncbi:archaellin/type IV pilin N-terminal domain-containing protein [Sulfodiicoccus acidiphilus]|nr:archaellin/type IV pilin N-terminal domain-containing protein [Sulfodiicoccus acidiphilus]
MRRRGLAGLDTAIILIAFIITASVLAYVAVNMGLFVTQKAKSTITKGEETASTALTLSGSVLYAVNYPTDTNSYWLYFPVSPSSGVSSVELSPATTAISFTASSSGIELSNIYVFSLMSYVSNYYVTQTVSNQSQGGQTYYYFTSPYAALVALSEIISNKQNTTPVPVNISTTKPTTTTDVNTFSFEYQRTTYYVTVYRTFAFTFPIAGFSLAGSDVAPAGSTIGVMVLFGPHAGSQVFQYQTVTVQITPNIGSPLTVSEYIYQPEGNVTIIG